MKVIEWGPLSMSQLVLVNNVFITSNCRASTCTAIQTLTGKKLEAREGRAGGLQSTERQPSPGQVC